MIFEALAGRRLLVTGVTGFLGKVWLAHLLHHVPDVHVTVIVRPRGKDGAKARFEEVVDTSPVFRPLREAHGAELGRWLGARLDVIAGDVERPLLGLGQTALDALEVDAIVHCAGLTDFQPDPLRAIAVNTMGAKHASDAARRLRAKLMHVSTAFVAGNVSGHIPEEITAGRSPNGTIFDPIREVQALQTACRMPKKDERTRVGAERAKALGWPNLYTYSKGLAEHILAGQDDLECTIVRPSIVECARTFPLEGWNEGLNTAGPLAWLISTAFRDLPTSSEHNFDIVPVDDVARGMTLVLAAMFRGEAAQVYQLAASDANPLTFGRTVELTGLGLRRWTRKGGGNSRDRLFSHLDPVPTPSGGLLPVPSLRKLVGSVRQQLSKLDPKERLPEPVAELVAPKLRSLKVQMAEVDSTLGQVERMLELYRPFILENDYTFRTDRIRSLGGALPAEEAEFAWRVPTIDWRWYWVDVEYPGLCTWSIPIIRGETIPEDPPSQPPFRLVAPERPALRVVQSQRMEAR